MANIKSSIKRIEVAERNNSRNRAAKSAIKTYTRNFNKAIEEGNLEEAKKHLLTIEKKYRKAEAKNILHKNNISRKIGQLNKIYNEAANQ